MQSSDKIYELLIHKHISVKRFYELKNDEDLSGEFPFFYYLFIALGTTFLLSGVLFFIAANWSVLPKVAKLLMLESVLVLTIVLAYYFRKQDPWFHLSMISASILVGINLAGIGQIYQTGADSFMLFALWTGVITPWAWGLRLPNLFSLWAALLILSLFLFWDQILDPFKLMEWSEYFLWMIALSTLFFTIALIKKSHPLFSTKVNQYGLEIIAFTLILIPFTIQLFDIPFKGTYFFYIFFIHLSLFAGYFYKQRALVPLSIALLYLLLGIELILAYVMINGFDGFLGFGFVTIIITLLFTKLIKALSLKFQKDSHE